LKRFVVMFAALALVAFGARSSHASCGAEGCPLELRGPEAGGGRFGFELGYQFVDQNRLWDGNGVAGPPKLDEHEVEVQTRTQSWMATARAQFGPRLLVTSTLPYLDRTHRHLVHAGIDYEPQEWHYRGLGDLLTTAQYTVLGGGEGRRMAVALRAGVKLPTGKRTVPEIDGEQPEPPARLGSGSTDFVTGFQVRRTIDTKTLAGQVVPLPISLSATYRANGKGTEDYRVGNEVQATLAGAWALSRPLQLLMQVNYRHHEGDEPGESGEDEASHTAGTSLYLTPGVRGQVTNQLAAFGYVQVRAYERTEGPQLVAPHHLLFGLSWSFKP
jgi:hypothetical protein